MSTVPSSSTNSETSSLGGENGGGDCKALRGGERGGAGAAFLAAFAAGLGMITDALEEDLELDVRLPELSEDEVEGRFALAFEADPPIDERLAGRVHPLQVQSLGFPCFMMCLK